MTELPHIYQQSKRSEFRKKIESTAIAPSGQEMRRTEFSKMAYERIRRIDQMGRGLVVDLPEYFRAMVDIGAEIESRLGEDRFYRDLFAGDAPMSGRSRVERVWLEAFERNGFVFMPNRGLNCGPLLVVDKTLGQRNFIAALTENESVGNSARADAFGINIIDTATSMEDAVFKINAYRFGEMEPVASMLLREGEVLGSPEEAAGAYRRRLGMIFDSSGKPDADGISKAIDELARDGTEHELGLAGAKVNMVRWSAGSIIGDASPDPLVHTANYLNSLVANAFISYGLCGVLKGSEGGRRILRTPDAAALSALAAMSFGEPYDKLAAISGGNLSGSPDHMLNHYLVRMNFAMGYARGQGQKKANIFVMTRSDSSIRKAALSVLQSELMTRAGMSLDDRTAGAFAEAGGMKPISGEQFQRIAGVWALRMGKEKQ